MSKTPMRPEAPPVNWKLLSDTGEDWGFPNTKKTFIDNNCSH